MFSLKGSGFHGSKFFVEQADSRPSVHQDLLRSSASQALRGGGRRMVVVKFRDRQTERKKERENESESKEGRSD